MLERTDIFLNITCLVQEYNSRDIKLSGGKKKPVSSQLCTKHCCQLMTAGHRRGGPSQEKAHQLVVHYQMVNPENAHTGNTCHFYRMAYLTIQLIPTEPCAVMLC